MPESNSNPQSAVSPATLSAQGVNLRTRVEDLPGVRADWLGPLRRLGIRTGADLLFHLPRSYEDAVPLTPAEQFEEGKQVAFRGIIESLDERRTQSGKHMLGALVRIDGAAIRLMWFNQPFRRRQLPVGQEVVAKGVVKSAGLTWEIVHPVVQVIDEGVESDENHNRPSPIYPLSEGIKQFDLRSVMRACVPTLAEQVAEVLPARLRQELEVIGIGQALQWVHFCETMDQADFAMRRFKLQELFVLQLAISMQRAEREQTAVAPVCEPSGKIHSRILNRLQLELTRDQLQAIREIGQDMALTRPMNRLLQGDVGSGKTVVAQYAMLLAVAHGYQAALMAPTEILARQHAATLHESLSSSRVRVALLTGSLKTAERRKVLEEVAAGEVDLLVGTQALLSEQLSFANLGLVIVDEQHKFGVLQRAKLRVDGEQPHYLVLSATPIPRTIAMTDFGDLDVSTIREKPPGRAKVHTYTASAAELESWWRFVEGKLAEGRQAFVIAPRIALAASELEEPSDDTNQETQAEPLANGGAELTAAESVFERLQNNEFAHREVALLHGRMDAEEKQVAMESFARGEIDVLVSTTVVEVGINVPNATVMTILDANRLGLAQLHQLRGRVCRGSHPGYVCAVAVKDAEEKDSRRLVAFQKTDDGFDLAELDLQLRGPGNLLGTSQSGLPPLRVANLSTDADLLDQARQVARSLLESDPSLEAEDCRLLKKQTVNRYGDLMQLSDIG
ncbi:MAG: ATP-dependent DNA helicase RecG [Pirellulaceae bacterium]